MNKLGNYFLGLLSIIYIAAMAGCRAQYPVVSVQEVSQKIAEKPLNNRLYIVLPEFDDSTKVRHDTILQTLYLIQSKKTRKASDFVQTLATANQDTLNFCKGVLLFYQNEYTTAYTMLQKSNVPDYTYLKFLIIGDCMREIRNSDATRHTLRDILKQYQLAMNATDNKTIKKIIAMHVKFAKYGE